MSAAAIREIKLTSTWNLIKWISLDVWCLEPERRLSEAEIERDGYLGCSMEIISEPVNDSDKLWVGEVNQEIVDDHVYIFRLET